MSYMREFSQSGMQYCAGDEVSAGIADLVDERGGAPEIFGNKAAMLSRILRAGFVVPPATFLAPEFFAPLFEQGSNGPELSGAPRVDLRSGSRELRHDSRRSEFAESLLRRTMPDTIIATLETIRRKYSSMAVRSSSLNEDTKTLSGAGQFTTVLGVSEIRPLVSACKQVLASQYSAHSASYYHSRSCNSSNTMGLIIQQMLAPDWAGVVFTTDPVFRANTLVVEACQGLGTRVVEGRGDIYRFTLSKRNFDVIKTSVPRHQRADSLYRIEPPSDCLSRLAEVACSLEKHFSVPLDIEWAYSEGKIQVLQARPITTLL